MLHVENAAQLALQIGTPKKSTHTTEWDSADADLKATILRGQDAT